MEEDKGGEASAGGASSTAPSAASAAGAAAPPPAGGAAGFQDPSFVSDLVSMMGDLPGMDPNDPAVKAAMEELKKGMGGGGEKKDGEGK